MGSGRATPRVRDVIFLNGRQQDDPLRRIDDALGDVAEIYCSAVETVGPAYYDPRQVTAWAEAAEKPTELGRVLSQGFAVIRYIRGCPTAVGQIDDQGHIGLLYVHGQQNRKGHGTALLQRLLAYAWARNARQVTVDASYFSARLFEKHGFTVNYEEKAEFGGQQFQRWRMQRSFSTLSDGKEPSSQKS